MNIDIQAGMPSVWMLVFTLLLWVLFAAILFSNTKNEMNRWGFIAGIFFSMGVLKEYLYFGVVPSLLVYYPSVPETFYTEVYSVMTAILYYLAMPAVVMVAFHFSDTPLRHPRFYRICRYLIFLPALLFGLAVPYHHTRYYQLNVYSYYLSVSIYNWLYGIWITYLLLHTLYLNRLSHNYRQKALVTVNVLLPMWYWLLTAFLIHSLKLYKFFKVWQGNIFIIFFLLIYFTYHLFQDGIWGTRLYRETYDLKDSHQSVRNNTEYVTHALKNEVTKIQWCASSLLKNAAKEQSGQLELILRSTRHLEKFMEQTRLLANDIVLHPSTFPVYPMLSQCVRDFQAAAFKNIQVHIQCEPDALIYTDREHLIEIVHNLLNNALDAISKEGTIQVSYHVYPAKRCAVLAVADDGQGISRDACRRLFQPYYTTKGTSLEHLGLGLYYCYHVMEKQGGGIRVKSIPSKGSTFFLYFPYNRKKYNTIPKEKLYEGETSDIHTDSRG